METLPNLRAVFVLTTNTSLLLSEVELMETGQQPGIGNALEFDRFFYRKWN